MRATCSDHPILLDLILLIKYGEQHKLRSSTSRIYLPSRLLHRRPRSAFFPLCDYETTGRIIIIASYKLFNVYVFYINAKSNLFIVSHKYSDFVMFSNNLTAYIQIFVGLDRRGDAGNVAPKQFYLFYSLHAPFKRVKGFCSFVSYLPRKQQRQATIPHLRLCRHQQKL